MFVLNVLPSFPLDGGKARARAREKRHGASTAQTFVAQLGLIVCLGIIWYALKFNFSPFMLVLAYWLFEANKQVFDLYGTPPWKRWN